MIKLFNKRKRSTGVVGVSIGTDRLAIAHLQDLAGTPTVAACEVTNLGDGKDAGEVLARRIKALGLAGLRCHCVLNPKDYALHLIEAPQVEAQEMRGAVRWKIKDLLDMKVDEAAVDVFPVPEDAYRSRVKMVYVVAAAKKRIRSVVQAITASGLDLSVIDIPELALKSLAAECLDDTAGAGLMDLRQTGSTLNLTRAGDLYLTRRINTQVGADVMQSGEWEMVRDRLVLEIQRSLDYFESQMGQTQIARIHLAPRGSDTQALAADLNDRLTVQVSALDLQGSLKSRVELTPELQQSCLAVIGTALRQRQAARKAEAA